MIALLIIADDLTGAIETGVQLAKQGISSRVTLHADLDFQEAFSEEECASLIVNTESRHIAANEAAEKVTHVVQQARSSGIKYLYKKTDSTMRGNVGAELEAVLNATRQHILPFIPAHPKLNRFTRKGIHYLGDQLLHETSFAQDPLNPIVQSNITEILHHQTDVGVHSIDASDQRSTPLAGGILVFDCQSTRDLTAIGEFLLNNRLHHFMAGSAAMVELLPKLLPLNTKALKAPIPKGPTLLVNGSLNIISLEQVAHARDHGISMVSIHQELLNDIHYRTNSHFKSLVVSIKTAIRAGKDIILNSSPLDYSSEGNSNDNAQNSPKHFESIALQMGLIVASILEKVDLHILTVFGGDTLSGIMGAFSCDYMEPHTEILPGIALSAAIIKGKSMLLISKPGGYGDKETIMHILDFIKKAKL